MPTLIGGSADLGPSTNCHCRIVPDGLCRVTPEFLAEFNASKKRTGARVFAVLVDVGSSAEVSVRQWADQVHRVVDLARDAQAAQDADVAVFGAI